MGHETNASSASGHYNAGATPCSSASSRTGRKSNRMNPDKDKSKSKRHAGRQQRRDHETPRDCLSNSQTCWYLSRIMRCTTLVEQTRSRANKSGLVLPHNLSLTSWKEVRRGSFDVVCLVCPCRAGTRTTRVSPQRRRTTAVSSPTGRPVVATITTTTIVAAEECRVRIHVTRALSSRSVFT